MNRTAAKILTPIIGIRKGRCSHCGISWNLTDPHETIVNTRQGLVDVKVLCEHCWGLLGSPEARLPYYRAMITKYQELEPSNFWKLNRRWQLIRTAVLEGK